jgi:Ca-activated chloride channel family protein
MLKRSLLHLLLLFGFLSCAAVAQMFNIPGTNTDRFNPGVALDAIQGGQMDFNIFTVNTQDGNGSLVQSLSASVSKLDLKAPGKAQREYAKGYQLLMHKDWQGAIAHLGSATGIYSSFVAAHNALGSAYLGLDQNEQAREEFEKAVALDDHLPNSYLNLGCAQLALKQYPAAEESLRKASSIAPLDLQLHTALVYGAYLNHDYPAVLETTHHVHERKHKGAAVVHYFAASALAAQDNLPEAQHELETLLQEDPKSTSADQFRQILQQMKTEQARRAEAKLHPVQTLQTVTFSTVAPADPTPEQSMAQAQQVLQDVKERSQIAEAQAPPDPTCADCGKTSAVESAAAVPSHSMPAPTGADSQATIFHSAADEVAIFFAATEHGRSVTNLTESDIAVQDDNHSPHAILGFRNESGLPLRLGLIIDTSNSVTDRISFEQAAAIKFLQTVLTGKDDLGFVVGVNNSVLLVQDFSNDQTLISHGINQLAPGGGTALWDAIAYGSEKLADRPEVQPVARVLIVISDGEDNSSGTTLKQAVATALRSEVAVYTVSTRNFTDTDESGRIGDQALKALSELTGGTEFAPGSVRGLKGSLADLQQVIRGRYLVSYKPASFQRDGRYRTIDIKAEKDGHKFKVYARKGYYASPATPPSEDR